MDELNAARKKILYLFDSSDWNSRIPVARRAKQLGHNVCIGLIGGMRDDPQFKPALIHKASGILSITRMLTDIRALIKNQKPDVLHTVTLKYAFLCAICALPHRNIKKIYTLAGLGYLFHGHSVKAHILRTVLKPVLSFLLKRPQTVLIFQNPDDMNDMIRKGYARSHQCHLIRGSGVDLAQFSLPQIPQDDPPLVLMPTRLVREKGIHTFIEAARILKRKGIKAKFEIAGGETVHNPRAIPASEMLDITKDGSVEWLGRVENMPALLSRASLIVYPSYYGEGIPRVLLEACAAGKAIVTTDHTGCREAVEHGRNGLLVPIRNPEATAQAIEQLLEDSEQRRLMEIQSRQRAETEFDINLIAEKTAELYTG